MLRSIALIRPTPCTTFLFLTALALTGCTSGRQDTVSQNVAATRLPQRGATPWVTVSRYPDSRHEHQRVVATPRTYGSGRHAMPR